MSFLGVVWYTDTAFLKFLGCGRHPRRALGLSCFAQAETIVMKHFVPVGLILAEALDI